MQRVHANTQTHDKLVSLILIINQCYESVLYKLSQRKHISIKHSYFMIIKYLLVNIVNSIYIKLVITFLTQQHMKVENDNNNWFM